MSGFVLGPHEGAAYGFHGSIVVIKASGEHTLGQLAVMESTYPPGSFVFVPRDRPHGFTVTSAGPAKALVVTGPPQLDRQIAARGEPATGA
jgi:hypothetical protein